MSDVTIESLAETITSTHALLSEVKTLIQSQKDEQARQPLTKADEAGSVEAIEQLRNELRLFRNELAEIQFVPRFDYIGDSVRRIGLFLEEYDKILAELSYLPESLNAIFSQMRDTIEQRLQAQAREVLLADYERRLRETIEQGQAREVLLADYERRLRETIAQAQARETQLAEYDRRLQDTTTQLQARDQQLAKLHDQLGTAYARLGIFRPRK